MNTAKYSLARYVSFFKVILLFNLILSYNGTAFARTQLLPIFQPNTLAETWVLEQVVRGQTADLKEHFSDEQDRVLSANFIQKLLTASLDIEIPYHGIQIKNAIFFESINLENADIPYETRLEDSRFNGRLILSYSTFQKNISLNGSTISYANFSGMRVNQAAFFRRAIFSGPVNFTLIDIATNLEIQDAQFTDPGQLVSFNSIKVGHTAFFSKAIFAGSVDFTSADIDSNFEAQESQFTNSTTFVTFNSMRVGHVAFFKNTIFSGRVDFINTTIEANFYADEAQFNSKEPSNFNSMKVGQIASFNNTTFISSISIMDGNFLDLLLIGRDTNVVVPSIDLSRTAVTRKLQIKNMRLQELIATLLHVEGTTFLSTLMIDDTLNLENSSFITLELKDITGPKNPILLDGITYQDISVDAGSGKDPDEELLKLVDRSLYSAQVYAGLEEFFQKRGNTDR